MFRCELTGEVSEPREKPVKVVVATRNRTYSNFVRGEEGWEEKVTYGTEIVKEVSVRAKHVHKLETK